MHVNATFAESSHLNMPDASEPANDGDHPSALIVSQSPLSATYRSEVHSLEVHCLTTERFDRVAKPIVCLS